MPQRSSKGMLNTYTNLKETQMRPIKPKNFDINETPKICSEMKDLVNGVTSLAKALNVTNYDPNVLALQTRVLDYLRDSRDYILWLEYHYEHEGKEELEKRTNERHEAETHLIRDDITKAIEILTDHSFLSLEQ